MNAPTSVTSTPLYAGESATVSWVGVQGATGYNIEARTSLQSYYQVVGASINATIVYIVPENASTVIFRVNAFIGPDDTWNEFDAKDLTWDALDALDQPWENETSGWAYSATLVVTPNRPPVISGQDSDIGGRYRGFTVDYVITDPDPNNTVSAVVTVDGQVIQRIGNVQQGTTNTATITDQQVFAMVEGSRHTIVITATDNKGASSQRTYTFTAVEDLVSTAIFYVLRDNVPIAKISQEQQWIDYLAVGTHVYKLRGVDKYDNFSDSNEVTLTTIVINGQLALASNPSQMYATVLRRNSMPGNSNSYLNEYRELRFEGRRWPIQVKTGMSSESRTLDFTAITIFEYESIKNVAEQGDIVVYRDNYNRIIFGNILSIEDEPQGVMNVLGNGGNGIFNYSLTLSRTSYNEGIPYD